jgi:hypothetical protein
MAGSSRRKLEGPPNSSMQLTALSTALMLSVIPR